jgi:hypothetical protein
VGTTVERNIKDGNVAFAARLSEAIGARSARAFGRACGISDSVVRQYLAAKSDPSRAAIAKMAAQAGVNLAWLATGEGPMRPGDKAPPAQHQKEPAMEQPQALGWDRESHPFDMDLYQRCSQEVADWMKKEEVTLETYRRDILCGLVYGMSQGLKRPVVGAIIRGLVLLTRPPAPRPAPEDSQEPAPPAPPESAATSAPEE